jgi:hypothetical protein
LAPIKRAYWIAGVALILGVCFDQFFYEASLGIGFPLYLALVVAGLFFLSARLGKGVDKQVIWLLIPLAFFGTMVFVRSSDLLTFLNVVASVLLLLLIAEASLGRAVRHFSIEEYAGISFVPLKFLQPLRHTSADLILDRKLDEEQRALVSQITSGLLMALPALFVFGLLFSSADLIFRSYITRILDIRIDAEAIWRLVLVVFVGLSFVGAYSYIFRGASPPNALASREKSHSIGYVEIAIFLGSINGLFLVFIVVQFAYLFGGERNIALPGVTYADYARRGFFQLMAVAVLSLLVLWTIDKFIALRDAGRIFKTLGSSLIAQVFVIMISAFMRLLLYERAYGFTTLRLYSHAFIVFLAVVFILFLHKIIQDRGEPEFAFHSFIAVIMSLVGMNLLNPDAFIARRNVERFATSTEMDVDYLASLSDDAVLPETIGLLGLVNEEDRAQFAHSLYVRLQRRIDTPQFSKWPSLNLSRMNAKSILEENRDKLEPYKDVQAER